MKKAIYPGSFDPITNGHLDILLRATKVFDHITLLLAVNPAKKSRFSVEERLEMMKEAVKDIPNVDVDFTAGLTVAYAKEHGASALIRGLRAVTDFEYEFQLAEANKFVDNEIEMVFFMANSQTNFISSSNINALHASGVDVSPLVPQTVMEHYAKK